MEGDTYLTTGEVLLILFLSVGPVVLAAGLVLWLNFRRRRKATPGLAAMGTALGTLMIVILTIAFWQLDLGWLAISVEPILVAPVAAGVTVVVLFLLWPRRVSNASLDDNVTRSNQGTMDRQ